jgi:hypothetical protein
MSLRRKPTVVAADTARRRSIDEVLRAAPIGGPPSTAHASIDAKYRFRDDNGDSFLVDGTMPVDYADGTSCAWDTLVDTVTHSNSGESRPYIVGDTTYKLHKEGGRLQQRSVDGTRIRTITQTTPTAQTQKYIIDYINATNMVHTDGKSGKSPFQKRFRKGLETGLFSLFAFLYTISHPQSEYFGGRFLASHLRHFFDKETTFVDKIVDDEVASGVAERTALRDEIKKYYNS